MCGIFGYIGKQKTAPTIVLEGLKTLEYRGYDSWGVAVVPKSNNSTQTIVVKKTAGKIGNASVSDLPQGSLAFGHTRWATHGGVTDKNAHPHLDCTGTIAVIHNGIVENYEKLKAQLIKKGHTFVSQTDTEVIAHLVEEYLKEKARTPQDAEPAFSKAVQQTFNDLEGLNAIILINTTSHEMVAARNGSPLVVGFGDHENFLSSDPAALLPHTKQVHFLEDDEMAIVRGDSIHIFNARSGVRIRPRKQMLTWTAREAEKGTYPYFMLKEIHEQVGLLSEIASELPEQTILIAKELSRAPRVYMIGAGTSAHAARIASYFFSLVSKKLINFGVASEFDHRVAVIPDKSVLVALSQSGETMDVLEIVKKAKLKDIKIFSLVNVVGSTLWRMSDMQLSIGAGPEKAVASTKAFIAKVAHLLLMAYAMAHNIKEGQNALLKAAKAAKEVTTKAYTQRIIELVNKLRSVQHMYIIGHGLSYCAALESALKIKEISYIHAEGIPAGELKHGTLALVTKGTVCMVFAPHDEHYQRTMANAMEMKARGGYSIGVSDTSDDVFDEFLPVSNAGIGTIIPNIIVGQLLAYYLTIDRGYDPDMPRNLAKSVTVK